MSAMTSITSDGRIEFRFYRPGAADVQIVGTFNNWNPKTLSMRPATQSLGQGWWTATSSIDAGEHFFRYIADGHWYTDFAANGVEKNKYGWNSILIVPERRLQIRPQLVEQTLNDNDTQAEAVAA
jgi:1,4-alpha-glucan branching enzyme